MSSTFFLKNLVKEISRLMQTHETKNAICFAQDTEQGLF